ASACRPLFCQKWDYSRGTSAYHFLYPFYNEHTSPKSTNWDFLGAIRGSHSTNGTRSFMIFPFFFNRDTGNPKTSSGGIFPFAGEVKPFFGYDSVKWSAFPCYLRLEKNGEVRESMLWPFFQKFSGPGCRGYAFWPLFGVSQREGQYNHRWCFWPLVYDYQDDLWKETPRHRWGFLPFYSFETWEHGESRSYLWPFFGYTHQTKPEYFERRVLWPFIVKGRGEADYVTRIAPFYTYSVHNGRHKQWIMWPLFKAQYWEQGDLAIRRNQFLYAVIWRERQYSRSNPDLPYAEKLHFWPFYSRWDNGAGHVQFQLLSPFAVFFPTDETINWVYNPLFALFRYEKQGEQERRSFLFNTIIHESSAGACTRCVIGPLVDYKASAEACKTKLLCGMWEVERAGEEKTFKFLGVRLKQHPPLYAYTRR
ncbi:MAG TPA: hypothetical protein PLV25_06125, partial [Opitutales bacterium]|nr:hypothetical protein [Opitutales bacterium]